MERKKALTLAGAAGISVIAVGTAMAANLGLLRTADSPATDVGNLTAEDASYLVPETTVPAVDMTPSTIVVDEYIVEDAPAGSAGAPTVGLSPTVGAPASDDGTPDQGPGPGTEADDDDVGIDPVTGTTPTGSYSDDDSSEYEDEAEYEDETEVDEDGPEVDEDGPEAEDEEEHEGAEDDD